MMAVAIMDDPLASMCSVLLLAVSDRLGGCPSPQACRWLMWVGASCQVSDKRAGLITGP